MSATNSQPSANPYAGKNTECIKEGCCPDALTSCDFDECPGRKMKRAAAPPMRQTYYAVACKIMEIVEGHAADPSHTGLIWKIEALLAEQRSEIAPRGECHDAAERDEGCFRALKAERELAELKAARCVVGTPIRYKATLIFDHETRTVSGEFMPAERDGRDK